MVEQHLPCISTALGRQDLRGWRPLGLKMDRATAAYTVPSNRKIHLSIRGADEDQLSAYRNSDWLYEIRVGSRFQFS